MTFLKIISGIGGVGFRGGSMIKNQPDNGGNMGSIPGSG